jgi:hypothetical protein
MRSATYSCNHIKFSYLICDFITNIVFLRGKHMPDICGLKISPFADHGKEFVFIIFNEIEREIPPSEMEGLKVKPFFCSLEILQCSPADRMEEGRITCGSMRACVRKV